MRLLTPYDVAEITGLSYAKALLIIKNLAHIQINNRYYVSETVLKAFIHTDESLLIKED